MRHELAALYWLTPRHDPGAAPAIVGAARQLLGTDDIFCLATHAFVKAPNTGGYVGWHQDLMYWGLAEGARVVSAWIAIDDSQPDNGCMRAVPGSTTL